MSNPLLDTLNPNQRQAVEILSGPLLILAGAGSGKTKTLTHRIAHLITSGTHPTQILAVTFTNKAAGEMKDRVQKLLADLDHPVKGTPSMGTFHSICVRILRRDIEQSNSGINRQFVIFDSDDAKSLVKKILKDFQIDDKRFAPRAISSHISTAKNQLIAPDEYTQKVDTNSFTEVVDKIFREYQKRLQNHNAFDFDDLLQKTVELFEECPDVLKKYRTQWKHLMVDEYQDTNFAQYRLVRLLSDEHKNLCVIGDDHQSIYSFRGADYTNILNFEKDFPEANTIKLEQNYRSSKHILSNANSIINKNRTGRKKKLWTDNDQGEKLLVHETSSEKTEGNYIAEQIQAFINSENPDTHIPSSYNDIAILYRMNAQSRAIEEALMRHQIPYQIVGGTRFFDRKEIKDIIAYLRLIFNQRDDLSFARIINTPTRKLGKATLEVIEGFAKNYTMSLLEVLEYANDLPLPETKKTVLKDFRDLIKELKEIAKENPISILLDRVIDKTKFLDYLNDGSSEGESRQQNVKELFSVAGRYDATENPLADFLEGVALISDIDQVDQNNDAVTMMTIHASKGLEFPTVFLPGWEEGIFPSTSSQMDPNQLEEERRLAYVAITRAEKKCTITHAKQRMLYGKTDYHSASTFLSELDENAVERTSDATADSYSFSRTNRYSNTPEPKRKPTDAPFGATNFRTPKTRTEALFGIAKNSSGFEISERVRHATFGEGTIIQISGDILSIAFKGQGIKKINASVAPLEKI